MQINDRIKIKATLLPNHILSRPKQTITNPLIKIADPSRKNLISDLGYYSPRSNSKKVNTVSVIKEKHTPVQMQTFSTKEFVETIVSPKTTDHENNLKKELVKFRTEIEVKYKNSQIAHTYKFPRNNISSDDSDFIESEVQNCIFQFENLFL